ncbi:hypothetical protein D3C77_688090 [compost metagenome]
MKDTRGTRVMGPAAISQRASGLLQKLAWAEVAVGVSSSQPTASGKSSQVSTTRPGKAFTGACLRISP